MPFHTCLCPRRGLLPAAPAAPLLWTLTRTHAFDQDDTCLSSNMPGLRTHHPTPSRCLPHLQLPIPLSLTTTPTRYRRVASRHSSFTCVRHGRLSTRWFLRQNAFHYYLPPLNAFSLPSAHRRRRVCAPRGIYLRIFTLRTCALRWHCHCTFRAEGGGDARLRCLLLAAYSWFSSLDRRLALNIINLLPAMLPSHVS